VDIVVWCFLCLYLPSTHTVSRQYCWFILSFRHLTHSHWCAWIFLFVMFFFSRMSQMSFNIIIFFQIIFDSSQHSVTCNMNLITVFLGTYFFKAYHILWRTVTLLLIKPEVIWPSYNNKRIFKKVTLLYDLGFCKSSVSPWAGLPVVLIPWGRTVFFCPF
jgi:hypothetical protein